MPWREVQIDAVFAVQPFDDIPDPDHIIRVRGVDLRLLRVGPERGPFGRQRVCQLRLLGLIRCPFAALHLFLLQKDRSQDQHSNCSGEGVYYSAALIYGT